MTSRAVHVSCFFRWAGVRVVVIWRELYKGGLCGLLLLGERCGAPVDSELDCVLWNFLQIDHFQGMTETVSGGPCS